MTGSIVNRLFRVAFGFYVIVAIILNILLVGQVYVDTKATVQRELAMYQGVFDTSLATALWAMDINKLDAIWREVAGTPPQPLPHGERGFQSPLPLQGRGLGG